MSKEQLLKTTSVKLVEAFQFASWRKEWTNILCEFLNELPLHETINDTDFEKVRCYYLFEILQYIEHTSLLTTRKIVWECKSKFTLSFHVDTVVVMKGSKQ